MKLSQLLSQTRRYVALVLAVSVISFSSVPAVFADSIADCTAPTLSTPGAHVPTGSDAGMYHYDCNVQLWVSAHYTYNPQTDVTLALDPTVYTYNPATGQWDYDIWMYIASKGNYALRTFSVSTPPAGATTVGGPVEAISVGSSTADTSTQDPSGSVLTVADTSNGTATAIAVTNSIGSLATSGDATVAMNTQGGSATSGDASAMATLINMLQSSGNTFGSAGNAVVFNTTISGDVTGDILLDPSLIGSIQPSGTSPYTLTDGTTLTHSDTDMNVTNNLSLGADSGNALVAANTNAGDATSGNATAVANVLNFLNSTIVSGRSFLGVINIDGNLNGDILLPPNFIDELLASNVPTLALAAPLGSNGSLDTSVSQSISNAVTATALTGSATVDKNTNAGNATTGNGMTNITTFNLTGNTIIGKNALLVFVNVLGTWYGLIFNAPSGATAAGLGGTITTASAASPQTVGQYDTNQTINNTIVATATSGDATVTKNTNAGNAQTGDAKVAVNILNVAQSALSLSDWFGILFINVLGSWKGSFGIDTAAGSVPQNGGQSTSNGSSTPQVFSFVPSAGVQRLLRSAGATQTSEGTSSSGDQPITPTVLAAQTTRPLTGGKLTEGTKSTFWIYATFITIWLLLIFGERVYSRLRQRHQDILVTAGRRAAS